MGNHRNVIELNGKTYDVLSGKIVDPQVRGASKKPARAAKSVDGFTRVSGGLASRPAPAAIAPKAPKPARTANISASAKRKPIASKTLMRSAVAKPTIKPTQVHTSANKVQERMTNDVRLKRAQAVAKSGAISRFGATSRTAITKKVQPLKVSAAPAHNQHHKANPNPQPRVHSSSAEQHFNRALANANSHEKLAPHHHKKRQSKLHKTTRWASVALAVILLAGFFGYQNVPKISMRIAANKAGFSANLPDHVPGGFGLSGPVKYGPGYISVNFASRNDDEHFVLSQQVSEWNSEALVDNFLVKNDKEYQTFEDKGRTIYVYEGSNATWVNGGVWYQIEGNNSLKNDELVQVASSM